MWVFYLFATLLIWQGVVSLIGGARYLAYVRRAMNTRSPDFAPFASIIAPCRGLDRGLRENLSALFAQEYPRYEIVFVLDDIDDPALAAIEDVRAQCAGRARRNITSRLVIAGRAAVSGQKVHNLIAGVRASDPASEVFVFVDSDVRPRADWLHSLIAPLADEQTGAATGYRWFVPIADGLASHLRAVWNASIASALGGRVERNFCWGGSTAIRRAIFKRLKMSERWRGTLSDDFALTHALRRARLPIRFVPNCLTASHEDCTFRELLEFTTRQLKITRVYAPTLWQIVLGTNLVFVLVFYGGLALSLARAWRGQSYVTSLAAIFIVFILGAAKAFLRLHAVSLPLASEPSIRRVNTRLAHLCLWPLTSALYLYNALAAGLSRRLVWRGITYELPSAMQTVIISDVSHEAATAEEEIERARPYA